MYLNGGAIPNGDGRKDDLPLIEFDDTQRHVLAEGDVVAEGEEIPSALPKVYAAMDVNALADARAEGAQCHGLKLGAFDEPPGNAFDRLLHNPVADMQAAPRIGAACGVAADERFLGELGDQYGERCVNGDAKE